ncbi:class I SAM-dependent methyltransferase [Planctobacterium marinum]|uniref:Methyltransferase n=1 Tax=Planctobacterium marinum TaxID=1631968 RepID=A0AA48HHG4_9ALTE|nr:methyltransferase [Planctobacterium marinum]
MIKTALKIAAVSLALSSLTANAEELSKTQQKLEDALLADIRSEKEVARDDNRLPMQTLEFFGFREDMSVVELVPGGGWYTKLLAPVLAENGQYYGAIGTSRIKERLSNKPGFENMQIIAEDANIYRAEGAKFYSLELSDAGLGITDVDMVMTFRNYHNFSEEGRRAMNKAAFDALKSGGTYAVVDHTARHMEAPNNENRRRFDPVLAIKEIQEAGFEFVDYSDLHHRLDDTLIYEVGRKSVTGNTDRWTLKFRKP